MKKNIVKNKLMAVILSAGLLFAFPSGIFANDMSAEETGESTIIETDENNTEIADDDIEILQEEVPESGLDLQEKPDSVDDTEDSVMLQIDQESFDDMNDEISVEEEKEVAERKEAQSAVEEEQTADDPEADDNDTAGIVSSGTCGDNLTWVLDENGKLVISGTGLMNNRSGSETGWFDKQSVRELVIEEGAENVGASVFLGCKNLNKVTIPATVTNIYWNAFADCPELKCLGGIGSGCDIEYAFPEVVSIRGLGNITALEKVIIPGGVKEIGYYAFDGCKSLSSVYIPGSVLLIDGYAFQDCPGLKTLGAPGSGCNVEYEFPQSIDASTTQTGYSTSLFNQFSDLSEIMIPDTVTSIGTKAFAGCRKLQKVDIPDTVLTIGEGAFENCLALESISIPDSITTLENRLFYYCQSLKEIAIPESVTSIGSYTFAYCSSLENIEISNKVTQIGSYVFQNCSALKEVIIPNTLSIITYCMFNGCTSLSAIDIPDSVTQIASDAFSGCTSLKNVLLPDSVKTISSGVFEGCSSLEEITLPDKLTEMGYSIFKDCTQLKEINVPDSVSLLSSSAFENCSELSKVRLSDSLQFIADKLFKNCPKLNEIIIPESVSSVRDSAFYNCSGLTEINLPVKTRSIYRYAFSGCSSLKKVSASSLNLSIGEEAFKGCTALERTDFMNITSLGENAFDGCAALETLGGVLFTDTINTYTFQNCTGLKNITISNQIKTIATGAFRYCPALTVDFYGSEQEWKDIEIQGYNDGLSEGEVIIHYHVPVSGLKLDSGETSCRMGVGKTIKLDTEITPSDAENKKIIWESYDPKSVVVDQDGTITAVSVGGSRITASTEYGAYRYYYDVSVYNDLESADITEIRDQIYTGNPITPEPEIRIGKTPLVKGEDYTISYSENTEPGRAAVTVTGIGQYTGSQLLYFWIYEEDDNSGSGSGSGSNPGNGSGSEGQSSEGQSGNSSQNATSEGGNSLVLPTTTHPASGYAGSQVIKIPKRINPVTVKAKAVKVKYSKLLKKNQKIKATKAFTVKNAQGSVTYKVSKYDKKAKKKITVSKSGKVTVKKGLKKGTYKVKVNVTAAGNIYYKPLTKTVTLKIKVK